MAVVVGRMVAVLEAQTAQFEARMDASARQLQRWTSATGTAQRGTQLLKTGFQQLALEGLGVLPPAVARVTAGFGTLAFGSPVVVGVLAGITAITAAYQFFARDTRAAEKAQNDFLESLKKTPQGAAIVARAALAVAQARLTAMEAITTEATRTQPGGPGPLTVARLEAQRRQVAVLENAVIAAERAAGDDRTKRLNQLRENAEAAQRPLNELREVLVNINHEIAKFFAAGGGAVIAGISVPTLAQLQRQEAFRQVELGIGKQAAEQISARLIGIGGRFAGGAIGPSAPRQPGFRFTPEVGQLFLLSLMSATQGGVPGAFGALGGLAGGLATLPGLGAAAGPLGFAGFGLTALGTIAGLFTNNADKNAEKIVRSIERLGEEVGLDRVTVVFTGPGGHEIRKTLAELEQSDAVERIPGPTGASG